MKSGKISNWIYNYSVGIDFLNKRVMEIRALEFSKVKADRLIIEQYYII